jgi:hypothetical protein
MGDGGGKTGHHHHHNHDTAKLLKAVSRTIEPRNFGIGLVAGFLLVTCAYFSTAKFDAIHIALSTPHRPSPPPSSHLHFLLPSFLPPALINLDALLCAVSPDARNAAAGIGSSSTVAAADGAKQRLGA